VSRAQFQAVMAGTVVAKTPHFVLHQRVLSLDVPSAIPLDLPIDGPDALFKGAAFWSGAMVPKRWAKRAVTRNAVKRQVFAVMALFDTAFKNQPRAAYVIRLRSGFDKKRFISASSDALKTAVRLELLQLFSRWLACEPSP
jgi:ribonuclease P protein component